MPDSDCTASAVEPSLGSPAMTMTLLPLPRGKIFPEHTSLDGFLKMTDPFFPFSFVRYKVHFHSQMCFALLVDDSLLWLLDVFAWLPSPTVAFLQLMKWAQLPYQHLSGTSHQERSSLRGEWWQWSPESPRHRQARLLSPYTGSRDFGMCS